MIFTIGVAIFLVGLFAFDATADREQEFWAVVAMLGLIAVLVSLLILAWRVFP